MVTPEQRRTAPDVDAYMETMTEGILGQVFMYSKYDPRLTRRGSCTRAYMLFVASQAELV
jgi:hypothetical protein